MGNTVILEAGLDVFEGRVFDAVAADALALPQALQVFFMAEDYFAFAAGKDEQILCRADLAGIEVCGSQGASAETYDQDGDDGDSVARFHEGLRNI
jgi:hypothetical protein